MHKKILLPYSITANTQLTGTSIASIFSNLTAGGLKNTSPGTTAGNFGRFVPPTRTGGKRRALAAFALGLTLAFPFLKVAAAGPEPVDLGSAAHFTILAGAAVTTTGDGPINGDVGTYPITGAAIHLTDAQVNGTIYSVDAAGPPGSVIAPALLLAAKGDLTAAFNAAASRVPIPAGPFLNPGAGNIGGLNLVPGLYKFPAAAFIVGGDLTLTGGPDDVWIFQVGADLQVGSYVKVILAGGAVPRNIFWQVTTSAVIDTYAVFKGTILADQSIVMKTGSSMDGRALASAAGVTYNGSGGSLPIPAVPKFTDITASTTSTTVTLRTTPYYLLTLETSPDLVTWSFLTSATPETSIWSHTHIIDLPPGSKRFYRAFLTAYPGN